MDWWIWLLLGILALAGYYVVWMRPSLSFWKLAQNHPNEAFDWFQQEDCWEIVAPSSDRSSKLKADDRYAGPFQHWVPKLGDQRIHVFGLAEEMESSQDRFMARYQEDPSST